MTPSIYDTPFPVVLGLFYFNAFIYRIATIYNDSKQEIKKQPESLPTAFYYHNLYFKPINLLDKHRL